MSTMNISLPDLLKNFVDEQVSQRGYGTSSEYVRELIRKDQSRLQLRDLLLVGAASAPTCLSTAAISTHCASACANRKGEGQAGHPQGACQTGC
ncbi:MAG: type II toxin-antitoxin system ParD family antitoxin [Azoarcus sp.]|jgi:antitoxin ParD1/3/4|nr:type II toxin-antitoxin system ParD family antitoxin [Azoarcus sp.]